MATTLITEKYQKEIHGVLHCYDRIVISGNLLPLCYAKGMTKYLYILKTVIDLPFQRSEN